MIGVLPNCLETGEKVVWQDHGIRIGIRLGFWVGWGIASSFALSPGPREIIEGMFGLAGLSVKVDSSAHLVVVVPLILFALVVVLFYRLEHAITDRRAIRASSIGNFRQKCWSVSLRGAYATGFRQNVTIHSWDGTRLRFRYLRWKDMVKVLELVGSVASPIPAAHGETR